MSLEIKINKERAEELVQEVYNTMKIVDLDKICKFSADSEKAEMVKTIESKLVQGFMVGLLDFNAEKRELTVNLLKELTAGEDSRQKIVFNKKGNAGIMQRLQRQGKASDILSQIEELTGRQDHVY